MAYERVRSNIALLKPYKEWYQIAAGLLTYGRNVSSRLLKNDNRRVAPFQS
jgi:hypothetical protein